MFSATHEKDRSIETPNRTEAPVTRGISRASWAILACAIVALPPVLSASGCGGTDSLGGGSGGEGGEEDEWGTSAVVTGVGGQGGMTATTGPGPTGNSTSGPSGPGPATGATSGTSTAASGTGPATSAASSGSTASSSSSSGGGGDGNCCDAHGGTGCTNAGIESCVCGLDPYCCSTAWDGQCASEASQDCGACGGSSSSNAASSSSSSASSGSGSCVGFGGDCWSSPYPCCSGYFCSNATGTCQFDASVTSASSGGGCSNPTGYGGLGCDSLFTQGCSQIGCSCCLDGSGIGHCC